MAYGLEKLLAPLPATFTGHVPHPGLCAGKEGNKEIIYSWNGLRDWYGTVAGARVVQVGNRWS